ncbi:TonB-dependent receptor plug domain-containing protein [Adhaeribacter terreus]|uniref:TonB-dependent receptor plug domain-containing protein n=1 Tax=Adhaeribacter terreus TaxID=529703 RepID=A0ABW0E5X2_9BACT
MLKKITFCFTLGALPFMAVQAQDEAQQGDSLLSRLEESRGAGKLLNEVIIQENRIQLPFAQQNRNIRIIDQAMIKTLPVRSVNELLSYVAGVDVRQRGPKGVQTDVSLDGGTFDQTLLLLNGVKISDPQTGHNMMNIPVLLDAIERIEILRGSAARIYGVNALTGAINIITKTPEKTGVSAQTYAGSSFKKDESNGDTYASYGVQATGAFVKANNNHVLSLSHDAGNGYRYNTAYKNQKAFYQGSFSTKNHSELGVSGGFIRSNFGANAFYAAPGDKEAEETVETALAAISYKTRINDFWILKPRISYRHNQDDYLYIKQMPDKFHNNHKSQTLNAELNNTLETGIGTFGLGLEARKEDINSTNLGERERTNLGVFSEYKFDKVEKLLVNVGAYTNYNSDYGWEVFPGMDAGYDVYQNWKVFMNVGSGQRLPTYTDLYYKGPTNIGNDQLKPETSKYGEGGLKYNNRFLFVNASYFYRRIDNFIDWVRNDLSQPWQPQNFQQINTQGYTFSADYRPFGAEQNSRNFNFTAGLAYTYLDPEFRKTGEQSQKISRYALESLRNQLTATVNLELYRNFNVTLAARHCERINYKTYTLVDSRLEFKAKYYSIYADATNLMDVSYIEAGAVPMPGRWYNLGLRFSM